MSALTPKQAAFVAGYLIDLNATKAAIRAGYSAKTANQQGPCLLNHPGVKAAVDSALALRIEAINIDSTWVLQRLIAEAEADLADLYDRSTGELLPVQDWPAIWRQGLVQGVETEELFAGVGKERTQIGVSRKVRLSDRVRRLELIGKHIRVNAFQETVNVKGVDGLADRMERAARRLEEYDVKTSCDKSATAP